MAIEACGSTAELARRLGIRASVIRSDWWRVPPRRVAEVAQVAGLTEAQVSRE